MPRTAALPNGPSFNLDAAMRERMTSTFGDLSAVKSYTPPVREQAPAPTGPYTGPVTHAVSEASPSPSVAGPMQAKRRDEDARNVKDLQEAGLDRDDTYALPGSEGYSELSEDEWETKTHTPNWFSQKVLGKQEQTFKVRRRTETEKQADRLFRVGAGVFSDSERETLSAEEIIDRVMPGYLEEEQKKGEKAPEKKARDRAKEYARKNKPKNIISPKDLKWYNSITENPSTDLIHELVKRRTNAAIGVYKERQKLGTGGLGENPHKLDVDASYSKQGHKMDVYDRILRGMTNDAMEEYQENSPSLELSEDEEQMADEGYTLLGTKRGGQYTRTPEGTQYEHQLRKQRVEALDAIYHGPKKKKK